MNFILLGLFDILKRSISVFKMQTFLIGILEVIIGSLLVKLLGDFWQNKIAKPVLTVGFPENRSGKIVFYSNSYKTPGESFDLPLQILANCSIPFSKESWKIIITLRPGQGVVFPLTHQVKGRSNMYQLGVTKVIKGLAASEQILTKVSKSNNHQIPIIVDIVLPEFSFNPISYKIYLEI